MSKFRLLFVLDYIKYGKKEKSYTEAISELQSILDKIESGDLDVDILSDEIKKASALLKLCKDKLYKTDVEIKKILDNLD